MVYGIAIYQWAKCVYCPPHYHSSTNKFARIVRNIIMHYQAISYLYRPTPLFAQHITRGLHTQHDYSSINEMARIATASPSTIKWNHMDCTQSIIRQHHNKVTIVTLVSPSSPKALSLLVYNMHWVLIFFYIDKHDQTGWRNGDSARIAGWGICLWERIVWRLRRIMSPDVY